MAEGLSMYGGPESTETQRFVRNFDKFFDCLNVRSPDEHQRRRKPNLKPYTSPADERLIVSWLVGCIYIHTVVYMFCVNSSSQCHDHTVAGKRLSWVFEGMGDQC